MSGGGAAATECHRSAPSTFPKLLTLAIVNKGGRLLLGLKKRGFGEGYYNGFGGKVEEGETIEEATARELEEESGIIPLKMTKQGVLTFHFDDKPCPWEGFSETKAHDYSGMTIQVHVFQVFDFIGEPHETDEMSPMWFEQTDIPFGKMWKDDPIWYPLLLKGEMFRGEFFFEKTHILVSHVIEVVQSL